MYITSLTSRVDICSQNEIYRMVNKSLVSNLIIICTIFLACIHCTQEKYIRVMNLEDLKDISLTDQDATALSLHESGKLHFGNGFLPMGINGRAIHYNTGDITFETVTDHDRLISIRFSVPDGGGRIRIFDADRNRVVDDTYPEGRHTVRFLYTQPEAIADYDLRIRWDPTSGVTNEDSRLMVTEFEISEADPAFPLSTVRWDSISGGMSMGPGCRVRIPIRWLPHGRLSGSVRADSGMASILVGSDSSNPQPVWFTQFQDSSVSFDIEIPDNDSQEISEIHFLASDDASIISWSNVEFMNVQRAVPLIEREGFPELPRIADNTKKPFNIILYVVDTVRRDHMQIYGYERATTPKLAEQAHDWMIWEDCRSLSSWTRPATASLLTGLDPVEHGTNTDEEYLREDIPLIYEGLREDGYNIVYLTTNGHVSAELGFFRGKGFYRHFPPDEDRFGVTLGADSLHAVFLKWFDSRPSKAEPFFSYFHAMEPHAPYTPPDDLISTFYPPSIPEITQLSAQGLNDFNCPFGDYEPWERDAAEALYDAEIAGWDRMFAAFLDSLRARGLLERTVVILTSDHGEEFAEHGGFSHGLNLYHEQLDVPFLVRVPGVQGSRMNESMDHRDVVDLMGWIVRNNDPLQWKPPKRTIRSAYLSRRGNVRARIDEQDKTFIWNLSRYLNCRQIVEKEFYVDDPMESQNSANSYYITSDAYRGVLSEWLSHRILDGDNVVLEQSEEEINRLRMLGYVQ